MKKLNHKEVLHATIFFWCSFTMLLFFSFLPVYFFLQSHRSQNAYITRDLNDYKELLNRHSIIKQKTDSLFNQMALLNTGKVDNDLFLEKYIAGNKNEIIRIIGGDSITTFRQYSYLMNNVNNMLKQKDTIISISNKEALALNDLKECMNKTGKVKKELSFDPTRSFTTAK